MNKILVLVLAAMVLIVGCKYDKPAVSGKLQVVTTLFPLYDFSRQIAGDKADVVLLLPPGVEPHGFEPRPGDILRISKADLFIYTGPFMEPWVDDILKGIDTRKVVIINASQKIELADEHESEHGSEYEGHHHEKDPHIWVDPILAQQIVNAIADGFMQKDPANKDFYLANAKAHNDKLATLDSDIRTSLEKCKSKTILYGGHFAFGYFARRYGLDYMTPYAGFSPQAEPTPKAIAELIEKTKALDSKYIYYEELIEPRVARAIAESAGAQMLLLSAAHNISKQELDNGTTYLDIMRGNLQRLKQGLGYQE